MKKVLICLIFSFIFSSCFKEKFISEKWLSSEAIHFGKRIEMVDDLIENHLSFGIDYQEIIKQLGKSTSKDSLTLKYILKEKYGKIDPNGYIYLKLDFDKNRKLVQWNIIETGYKE